VRALPTQPAPERTGDPARGGPAPTRTLQGPIRGRGRGHGSRGTSLSELLVALAVLAIGLLAMARLFPSGARAPLQDRMLTTANYYAQEKLEAFAHLPWDDPALGAGRHPPVPATEDLGRWRRFYEVTVLDPPLENVKKITVTVIWDVPGRRSVTATTYVRRPRALRSMPDRDDRR
jgi:hypothetical protein